jgi:hypothetical protein
MIIAATWLIGLGLVFLIRDVAALDWGEAWPLFVILAGSAMLVSSLVGYRRLPAGAWSLAWPLAWIAIGALLLLSTTGAITAGPGDLVTRWWPAVLIAIGVWFLVASVWPGRKAPVETLNLPLAGAAAAEVRIRFGAGQLSIERGSPGSLVSGTFTGGVNQRSRGPGNLELEPDSTGGWPWWHTGLSWRVGLTGEVPLDLRLDCGASRSTIDLSELLVRRFDLKTGASETRVQLPRAAGATWMRAETGVAALTITVPPGVAAHIRTRMALGSTAVDESRFPRSVDGYASPDFATAPNRVEIEVQGGVGSVRIG